MLVISESFGEKVKLGFKKIGSLLSPAGSKIRQIREKNKQV